MAASTTPVSPPQAIHANNTTKSETLQSLLYRQSFTRVPLTDEAGFEKRRTQRGLDESGTVARPAHLQFSAEQPDSNGVPQHQAEISGGDKRRNVRPKRIAYHDTQHYWWKADPTVINLGDAAAANWGSHLVIQVGTPAEQVLLEAGHDEQTCQASSPAQTEDQIHCGLKE